MSHAEKLQQAQREVDQARADHAKHFLARRSGPLDDRIDAQAGATAAIHRALRAARELGQAREDLARDIISQIG